MKSFFYLCVFGVLCVLGGPSVLAQFQMPDPKQMSGIPRPVTDLPDSSISVRLIRGQLSNNITGLPVELHIGSKVVTVKTDENGRAQFDKLTPGSTAKAVAVVDGERLESQEFPVPAQGGIRLMLAATDRSKGSSTEPTAPAVSGQVSLGGQSRIVVEPVEDGVRVYYLLEIANNAQVPVTTTPEFGFDLPRSAAGATLLEGSSPLASVKSEHVSVAGPFPPGRTVVQIGYFMPASDGSLELVQRFPATLEQPAVVVKKIGTMRLRSPQLSNQQDMTAQGEAFMAATGAAVQAGQPIVLTIDDLPHHSSAPRWLALSLALAIAGIGVWVGARPGDQAARASERSQLIARRERLFKDLVRLESERRQGRGDASRYAARREELVTALEHVYGALDGEDTSPEPGNRTGLAA